MRVQSSHPTAQETPQGEVPPRYWPGTAAGASVDTADAAAAVVADAVAIALESEAEAAAEQVLATAAAIAAAAKTAADAAAKARGARAFAVAEAARIVASDATRTATRLEERAEATLAFIADETRQAMEVIASYDREDGDRGATLIAMRLMATMQELAEATARDTASAAAFAADAVAATAAELAAAASAVDLGVATEVSDAAEALRAVNSAAARRVAGTTHARAVGAAIAAWEAAAAVREERLRKPDAAQNDFVATASHELRTPLTSIAGYAEMLQDEGGLTATQTGFVDAIVRNAARLGALTGDLLLLAGFKSTRLQMETLEVDLRAVVSSAEEVIKTQEVGQHLVVSFELPGDPVLVSGDARHLERVVLNLMSNAIKFTQGEGTVICRLASSPTDVFLTVSDTGIGIPLVEQAQLFDQFFRGAGARDQAIQGAGLGLHIVATIVSNHGGDITVDSVADQGNTFTVRLPRISPSRRALGQ